MDRADERSYHPHSPLTCSSTAVPTPEFSTQLSLPQSCPFFLISPPNLISYRPRVDLDFSVVYPWHHKRKQIIQGDSEPHQSHLELKC